MATVGTTSRYEEEPPRDELVRLSLENVLRYGISQRAFSRETGIPRSTIGDFLRGTHAPSEATLGRIEEALGRSGE